MTEDQSWVIERMHSAASQVMKKRFAHLLGWLFKPNDSVRINAVLEAAELCPILVEVMPVWLAPMDLDSEATRKVRERYQREIQDNLLISMKRPEPKLLSPPPGKRLIVMLDQFEAGDTEAWWKLHIWLEVEEHGNWCADHFSLDMRKLAGWKNASDETRGRMMTAAERYVHCSGANPQQWFSRRNVIFHPAVAGFRALLLIAHENPATFETLTPEVWCRWMPAILRFHYYDEADGHRLLTTKAFEQAPDVAVKWLIKVLNAENKEEDNLWILSKLPEKWSEKLGSALLDWAKRGRLRPQNFYQLVTALLEAGVFGALNFTRSKIPRKLPESAKRRQLVLHAVRLTMLFGERGDWTPIWNLVRSDSKFGKSLVEGFSFKHSHSPSGILKILFEADVSRLWEWMLTQYPIAEDPDRSRSGEVDTRHSMADLRNNLISYLADLGTPTACDEIQRLIAKYPQFAWFQQVLLRAQEQKRRLTWNPITPAELFQLATSRRSRLVQSTDQLLEAIMDSLNELQKRLRGETPLAQFLWDDDRHKPEEAISEWIKVHLEDDLKQRGVVLGREVQIHQYDRTDIHVTAVTKNKEGDFDNVKVIIEVKGSWNRELKTAMKTQLVERYLKDNDCCHGLYLVAWFPATAKAKNQNINTALNDFLTKQAQALSTERKNVHVLVIDCSVRSPAHKQRPQSRKKRRLWTI